MVIPFLDLNKQYQSIKESIDSEIQKVIDKSAFVRGEYVSKFEREYAKACGANECIACGNGTDAIYITLKALGIGHGDEVITTALSWISSSETITQAGAKVIFADVEPNYFTIDPDAIEGKITENTKAIIAVHLYGQSADMDRIVSIANKHKIYLIEDCAQAHFATYKESKVGTFGVAGTFSFYPGKNLGAYGDAGAIVTNDRDFALRARIFSNHGSLDKHDHQIEGINSRMDGIQAAVLLVKLKYIFEWNNKRQKHGIAYNESLTDLKLVIPPAIRSEGEHVFHLYVIRSIERDRLRNYLQENGIATSIHYPVALPFVRAYRYLGLTMAEFPIAHKYQSEILSIPIYPELMIEERSYIINALKKFDI